MSGNSAEWGGGIFNGRLTAKIVNSILSGNSATDGGRINNGRDSMLLVANSTFS